jgi:hypothetical protein
MNAVSSSHGMNCDRCEFSNRYNIEVIGTRISDNSVVLGQEILDGDVPHEESQIQIGAHGRDEPVVRCEIDGPHELFERSVQRHRGPVLVSHRIEQRRVGVEIRSWIREMPLRAVLVFEQVPIVLGVTVVFAEYATQKILVDRFNRSVQARVLAVDEELHVRFAG